MTEVIPASLKTTWNRLRHDISHGLSRWRDPNGHGPSRPLETLDEVFPSFILTGTEPRIDVRETHDAVLIMAERPGLERDDFSVELNPGYLVLRGEKKNERDSREGSWHVAERAWGAFYRAIPLPCEVERGKVDAKFRNGVLRVRLTKSPEARGRRIDIKVA